MKANVYKSITDKVNAIAVAKWMTREIKDKWRMMISVAKKDYSQAKQQRTGGGNARAPVKETSQRIIELFEDEPSFSGITGGIESGRLCNFACYFSIFITEIMAENVTT